MPIKQKAIEYCGDGCNTDIGVWAENDHVQPIYNKEEHSDTAGKVDSNHYLETVEEWTVCRRYIDLYQSDAAAETKSE